MTSVQSSAWLARATELLAHLTNGFEDVQAYAMYEEMFAHAISHVGMSRIEARFGSGSPEFKMATEIHAAINDSSTRLAVGL